MQIKYYNTNFDNLKDSNSEDKKITEIISKLPALNMIFDQNLFNDTIKIVKKFEKNKKKIIVFGTGGSNLGARALDNIVIKKKIKIEFYDNIDPIFFENSHDNVDFKTTGFIIVSKSGSTPETLSQFSSLYQLAIEKNKPDEFLSNI